MVCYSFEQKGKRVAFPKVSILDFNTILLAKAEVAKKFKPAPNTNNWLHS